MRNTVKTFNKEEILCLSGNYLLITHTNHGKGENQFV